ncbi:MAG TPA: DNA polymerase III, partial [Candidatus Merdenecus merdavium]|nr:DNA polymerase III [Candidatus Merdenecus merdavium]
IYFEDGRSRKNLEYAVGFLNIEKDHTFHRAFEDAFYTSMIMKYMDPLVFKKNYSIDFFNNPKTRKDEIYVVYEGYSKFISKEFKDKELAMADREVVSTRCYQCNKNARKKIRWFTSNTKLYYCLAYCEEHGFIKGTISMKKAENGNVFCVKKIKLIDDQETKMLQEKREMLREKKRIKKRKLRVDLKV